MTIPKKISKIWDKELREYGIMAAAAEMGLNYRTLNRAMNSGECSRKTFDTVNVFLLRARAKRHEIQQEVEKQTA